MDHITQAIYDDDINAILEGRPVRQVFADALYAGDTHLINYLLPYVPLTHLRIIIEAAKSKQDWDLVESISKYLENPSPKTLPKSSESIPTTKSCTLTSTQFSDYRIDYTYPLGEGSYGSVYAGVQLSTRAPVAIKIMDKSQIRDMSEIEHECAILSKLDHPNIVKIYGGYEDDSFLYWILSLAEGGTLGECLAEGPLSERACGNIFGQLVVAISYLHGKNIIHRDLKPENILILDSSVPPEEMQVIIADFGFASYQKPGDLFFDYRGTPQYASPELYMGLPYNGRAADIWALGVILFQMKFGYLPFIEPDLKDKIVYMDPPMYEEDVISKYIKLLLKKNPAERPTIQNLEDAMS